MRSRISIGLLAFAIAVAVPSTAAVAAPTLQAAVREVAQAPDTAQVDHSVVQAGMAITSSIDGLELERVVRAHRFVELLAERSARDSVRRDSIARANAVTTLNSTNGRSSAGVLTHRGHRTPVPLASTSRSARRTSSTRAHPRYARNRSVWRVANPTTGHAIRQRPQSRTT